MFLLGYPEYVKISIEMHSKRRYKICNPVILGELVNESFRTINKGFSQSFSKISDAIDLITFSIKFLNPKILLSFSFFFEK